MKEFEKDIFAKKVPDFKKMLDCGFLQSGNRYVYEEDFLDGDFRASVVVDSRGNISGMVYDVVAEEEYMPLRIESYDGAFVNTVRDYYEKILLNLADTCFGDKLFVGNQANRIAASIFSEYGHTPDFPWNDSAGVFRNPSNQKWYGLVMRISLAKLTQDPEDEEKQVDVLNLKINAEDGDALRSEYGIYKAYHMNHKSWISIRLDDSLSDDRVMELIGVSYGFTLGRTSSARKGEVKKWIVPANPKYYDIIGAFTGVTETIWKQGKGIEKGDIVYMYVAAPYSAILYKCTVLETHIGTNVRGGKANVRELMKVRIDERYSNKKCTLYKMKLYGVTTVRGPRYMPEKLIEYLEA
ncbi:MAG: MmcQ/YjbR family DNA-binding protein [Saccharofermentans sp.]|nr:MmcQ/YjbR family DNA-binding protein [Saccharofermentans sp.]